MSEEEALFEQSPEEKREEEIERQQDEQEESERFPHVERKHNVHTFLAQVRSTKDTTKVGNLTEVEIGEAQHSVRTYKELALIAKSICENPFMEEFFNAEAENILATSLSRGGKLINLAVVQKRVIEDETKPRKENKGWFKPKNKPANTETA